MTRKVFAYLLIAAVSLVGYGPVGMPMAMSKSMAADTAMAAIGEQADMASMPCADDMMAAAAQKDSKQHGMDPGCSDPGQCMARCAMLHMVEPHVTAFAFNRYPKLTVTVFDWAAPPQAEASPPLRPPRPSILS